MFIGEIGVIDKNGQPVGMVGNVSLGASTKLSCYTGQNLNSGSCAKAKKAVNYKGSACCASSTSYLNDGDASTIHGAYLQNAKGVDTIILTLNKPTQINTVTITGGGPNNVANPSSTKYKYEVDFYADTKMLRNVGETYTGMLPIKLDKMYDACHRGQN